MKQTLTPIIERDAETGLYVGFVPGFPGAHAQGESLDEVNANLREVIEMLLEEPESPRRKSSNVANWPLSAILIRAIDGKS